MVSLGKPITDACIDVPVYTYYAGFDGITSTLGETGKDQFRLVHELRFDQPLTERYAEYLRKFQQQYPEHDVSYQRTVMVDEMLAKAIEKAGSADPMDVSLTLQGLEHTNINGEKLSMRSDDYQLFQPVQISVHANEAIEFDGDSSSFGLRTKIGVSLENTMVDHSCRMHRPR